MTEIEIDKAIAYYKEQEAIESNERAYFQKQINELEIKWAASFNKNIYKLIYKPEYGNYIEFCNLIASRLRKENQ